MDIAFAKMHGAGNDFVVIDARSGIPAIHDGAIRAICERRRGVGSDGLILVERSDKADFRMRYFNSDGGEADMCGNGARCVARFAYELGIAGEDMTFETRATLVKATIEGADVKVRIGPVTDLRLRLSLDGVSSAIHFAVCGVPHAVMIEEDIRALSREAFVRFARPIRSHPALGEAGANVNIVSIANRHRCVYRTYERGVEDETLACGTGAVVTATALAHLGLVAPPVECVTSGGDTLLVDLAPSPGGATETTLAGPAVISFCGTLPLEDYERS